MYPVLCIKIIETTGERASGEIVVRVTGFAPSTYRLMTLSAFSLPSFAGGIAGVASGLPLFFHGGFPRGPLSEFRIAGLLLGSGSPHKRQSRRACAAAKAAA